MTAPQPAPATVFHYTNAEGLLGIMHARALWVTDAEFLNDPQEVRHAVGALEESLQQQVEIARRDADHRGHDSLQPLLDALRRRYPKGREFQGNRERTAYVTSFCREGDLLSMWRSYARGSGFSIELDTQIVLDVLTGDPTGTYDLTAAELERLKSDNFGVEAHFLTVRYDENNVRLLVDRITTEMWEGGTSGTAERAERLLDQFTLDFTGIKHDSFKEEEEERLVVFPTGDLSPAVRLRSSDGRLVPYIAVTIPHEAIRSVTIGPGGSRQQQRVALERHFGSSARGEWGHVEFKFSTTPFNG